MTTGSHSEPCINWPCTKGAGHAGPCGTSPDDLSSIDTESHTAEQSFYRVEKVIRTQGECECPACQQWTIVYDLPEPTEIGTSWQGENGKEMAEDICDLMNMAYDAGKEARYDATVRGQAETIEHLRGLLRECLEAWEGTGPGIVLDRIRAVVNERPS